MSHAIAPVRETHVPAVIDEDAQKILQLVVHGNLAGLSPEQKVTYYQMRCDALGLDWRTKPFAYVKRDGVESLYLLAEGAHQLRANRGIHPLGAPDLQFHDDHVIVTVTMVDRDGRKETDIGVVALAGLRGQAYGDAIMKAVTKARRRCTLALCGLGAEMVLDGDEIDVSWEPVPDEIDEQRAAMRAYNRSISGPRMPTSRLFKRFWATAREHGWHDDEVHGCIFEQWGHESVNQITHDQMHELINRMTSGPRWVDPRQRHMQLETGPDGDQEVAAGDSDVESDDGVTAAAQPAGLEDQRQRDWDACKARLESAASAKEVNQAWKHAMEVGFGSDPDLRLIYDARIGDFHGQ